MSLALFCRPVEHEEGTKSPTATGLPLSDLNEITQSYALRRQLNNFGQDATYRLSLSGVMWATRRRPV